jgi:puromycin-sensitive aminopeptidase
VSHLLNPHRLPRTVVPSRYKVSLAPQLDEASFTGIVSIFATATEPSSEIVLNAIELTIHSVTVNGRDCPWELMEDLERLVITCDTVPGEIEIGISFTGILNDKLRGFYRSTFVDDAGKTQTIATTQMQSTDCRRAFPCFDEPDFKAVFAVDLTVSENLLAISNSPEIRREDRGDGTVRVWFSDTMVMSTYLVAFVVGPLEATAPVIVGDVPLRLVYVPGKSHLTAFGLEIGAFALEWFQNYYGIAYPGEKVDLIALPDFAMGAMENVGCITFREVLLLVDPATSTQVEQELVADVVAHELAHMWFGDLVTMSWWNGIWLNEAFATFMEIAACHAFAPQWKRWTSFGLERSAAFEVDSLHATRTVEFPVHSPADAEGMFDVLTYQKGGALLRMLEQYLGEERFRAGVSHYLKKHSYGNTETNDLWDAIEEVVLSDGGDAVPVRQLMDSWIWQAGYPLVSAHLDGTDLVLSQRQFTYDNSPNATVWVVPIHVRNGDTTVKVLLNTDSMRVALPHPHAAVVINAQGPGFYRVDYSTELMQRLTGDALATLDTLERYNLVDDAWNATLAGAMTSTQLLAFLKGFTGERDLAVWQAMTAALKGLGRVIERDAMAPFQKFVTELATAAYTDLGTDPVAGEPDLRAKLRGLLLATLAVLGNDPAAQQRSRAILLENASSDPELVASATSVVASTGDASDYNWFLARFREPTTPQERIRMLYALAEFDNADLMERTCEMAFTDEVKSQDAPFLLNRCVANKYHGAQAWTIVRTRWQEAEQRFPSNTIIRMASSVTTLNTAAMRADVQSFFTEHPLPQSAKTLEQVLERHGVNVALRERESASMSSAGGL